MGLLTLSVVLAYNSNSVMRYQLRCNHKFFLSPHTCITYFMKKILFGPRNWFSANLLEISAQGDTSCFLFQLMGSLPFPVNCLMED